MKGVVRVAFLPSAAASHPYLAALGRALEAAGVEVVSPFRFRLRELVTRRREVDVLHVHWPAYFYLSTRPRAALPLAVVAYALKLVAARMVGYRIVWTVHNLVPHEAPRWAAAVDRWVLCRVAHALICHCREVAGQVGARLGRTRGVWVVPHGPLPDRPAGDAPGRARARAFLRVPEGAFLYVFLGELRPYKGVEELLNAYRERPPDADLLIVAGMPRGPEPAATVRRHAAELPHLRAILRRIPEHRMAYLVRAADAVVLPYRRVTTSGLLHLAMAVGAPIVAPRLGCIPEAVDDAFAALYAPDDPRGLARALEAVRRLDPETARAAARARAATSGWDRIADLTRAVYAPPGREA